MASIGNSPRSRRRHRLLQTRYNQMVLESNEIPVEYNISAAASLWFLLAGFIVLPGSFTSLQNSKSLSDSEAGKVVQHAVQHVSLLVIAWVSCVFGAVGICCLWHRWPRSYVWLVDKLFLPGFLNSILGLTTTLINVKTAKGSHWSIPAVVTIAVTGTCTICMLMLFLVYNYYFLRKIKESHDQKANRQKFSGTEVCLEERKLDK